MNYLILDCEVEKCIPKKGESLLPQYQYCEGWRDFKGMGISVTGAYDGDRYRVFETDNKDELQRAIDKAEMVIGFNSLAFDGNLLKEAWGIAIPEDKHLDLLVEIWKAAGLSETFQYPSHAGYGLDAICEINFGVKKTGHGAQAPMDWQDGKRGTVIDYCLNDIAMTRKLFNHIVINSSIINPKTGEEMKITLPLVS